MILVISKMEGEYDACYDVVTDVLEIDSKLSGDELNKEYVDIQLQKIRNITKVDNVGKVQLTSKEYKRWCRVSKKVFKEYTFKNFLMEKYKAKPTEFTTYSE